MRITDEVMTGAVARDLLRNIGMPCRARIEVERDAMRRSFNLILVYGIHGAVSDMTESILEDTAHPGELVLHVLERMRDLLVPIVIRNTAQAWAELHRPEGVP